MVWNVIWGDCSRNCYSIRWRNPFDSWRTTEIYGSPFNSLLISDSTKLVDEEDNIISITDFSRGDTVMVVLKDSFDEELIFYYPTVYQVRLISSEK